MTKLNNSNFDKTQKHKLWQNLKKINCDNSLTHITGLKPTYLSTYMTVVIIVTVVTVLTVVTVVTEVTVVRKKNLSYFFLLFYDNPKLKLWQNSKSQIVTKLQNLNCVKTQ